MSWLEFRLRVVKAHAETFEARLFELGALAVTYRADDESEVTEPAPGCVPVWERIELTALFDARVDAQTLKVALSSGGNDDLDIAIQPLADRVWERAWMEHYRPMRFGRRLWVVPSFAEPPAEPEAVCLRLDPGLAFGSGMHATTALCLEYLDRHPPAGKQVVDYGCGSGILALASLKLGAACVLAVDHDPQAMEATRENLVRNGLAEERLKSFKPDDPGLERSGSADLLLANILSSTLIELAPKLRALVKRGGQIVLSGILAEQAESVSSAYGFSTVDTHIRDGWVLLCSEN